ncbi:HesB/IscA family protein [Rhodopila globiformis]|uniref:Iron-sulfur cluster assembly accessory protein n=1 Tax=Rhodopila globiformis TaxID=1071 RepID=A0A2S6NKG3_RHOGL|nr:iron-sulfur cluster assembly accessory protein [Rhodopila globiformis]PPQ35489.1 iron-sulfur cluster assembly accessory protein [Rhodopila globiformis]
MISLTDNAINAVRTAMSDAQGGNVQGLRIMVQVGGCAGVKYSMGLVRQPAPTDFVVEQSNIRVYIDPESEPHLRGTTVDFVAGPEASGFTFDNPNVGPKCSCSKSCH